MFTWTASNTLIRISMLLLYIRLFPNRKFVIFSWAFLAENVVCAIATFIATSLICQPFAYNWDPINIKGRCGDKQKFYLWHGINNLLSDIIVTTMPMPLLWGLQLPLSKKISISLMFSMGIGYVLSSFYNSRLRLILEQHMHYYSSQNHRDSTCRFGNLYRGLRLDRGPIHTGATSWGYQLHTPPSTPRFPTLWRFDERQR